MVLYTVNITNEILKQAMYCGYKMAGDYQEECAIKLALKADFPEAIVSGNRIYLNEDRFAFDNFIELPTSATTFIKTFDQLPPEERINMYEFDLVLQIPDELLEPSQFDIEFA